MRGEVAGGPGRVGNVVLMEAMAARIPCISTHVAGIHELIRDGQDGLLVSPSDELSLADALTAPVLLLLTFTNGIGLAMRWPVFAAIVPQIVQRDPCHGRGHRATAQEPAAEALVLRHRRGGEHREGASRAGRRRTGSVSRSGRGFGETIEARTQLGGVQPAPGDGVGCGSRGVLRAPVAVLARARTRCDPRHGSERNGVPPGSDRGPDRYDATVHPPADRADWLAITDAPLPVEAATSWVTTPASGAVVTFLGVEIGGLMSGAVVTEGIFNIPGVGGRLFQGIRLEDGPLVVTIAKAPTMA